MCSFIPRSTRIKLDWFVDGQLKQTFSSYEHTAQVLKKELNNEFINNVTIINLISGKTCKIFKKIQVFKENILINTFKNNIEFMIFYNIIGEPKTCNVINGKVKIKDLKDCEIKIIINTPDIRFHKYEETDIYRICSYCEEPKPFTNEFFYMDGFHDSKCKKCNLKKIGNKRITNFMENINENWKNHPDFNYIYFEKDTENIFSIFSGKYLTIPSLTNITHKSSKDLKWESFYGKIPENKIVKFKKSNDGIELDNLDCNYVYCKYCKKIIQNPLIVSIYCSDKCSKINYNIINLLSIKSNINNYLRYKLCIQKFTNKKYNVQIDYNTDYLLLLGMNCYYCNVECKYGYEKEANHPDTLSYDKKNPDIGYTKENIVICCWFCNRMKNQTKYHDWVQFIDFIKNSENTELDLSNKQYAKKSSEIKLSNIYFHIKQKSPKYYSNLKTTKQVFINQCQIQNYLDPFFNFFPIIYLETNCLFNASIDAIDSSLPKEEKHRPSNIQIIPKCLNYGKSVLSQKQFIKEWIKRGFKSDFTNCSVKLPDNYSTECYFNKIINLNV